VAGEVVVVYSGEQGTQFRSVAEGARYQRHNPTTASTLREFNPLKHGLFAFSEKDIVFYDLSGEKAFYSHLLRSSPAFYLEPFYRLSLAVKTEETSLIRPVYFACANQLTLDAPEFVDGWTKVIGLASPLIEAIQRDWMRKLQQPKVERRSIAASSASASASPYRIDPGPVGLHIISEMNSGTITGAVTRLALEDPSLQIGQWNAYGAAIRTSLGFADSHVDEPVRFAPESGYGLPPNSEEVGVASGLSLPHLEFRNIILSKASALKFLQFSGSSLQPELREVFRPETYERHFGRRAIKIKRRQVFTYAEVLSMVGYRGTIESWPPL
jgi:hypothetical protein